MLQKYKHGFLLGKFYPPHAGHQFMCDFALEHVEKLTILVCSLASETIPGELRCQWMKDMLPKAEIVWCHEELPQLPEDHPDFWNIWNDVIHRYAGNDVDAIFASEPYGKTLADNYGCQFVLCDTNRETIHVSATMIRNNPQSYWNYVPMPVRPYFSKRICMIGVESTGKTTLAKRLAECEGVGAKYLPEYGRLYTEFHGPEVNVDDMRRIVQGHLASRKALEKTGPLLIIEDTDFVMSAIWSELLTGQRDPWFDQFTEYADLYILCDIDLPWVDDGTRYFPDAVARASFHEKVVAELQRRNLPYITVRGKGKNRLYDCLSKLNDLGNTLYENNLSS